MLKEDACDIAAVMGKAGDIAMRERIVVVCEHHDRHRLRCHDRRFEHDLRPAGEYHVDSPVDELGCHCQSTVGIGAVDLHKVDMQVVALLPAEHTQLLYESSNAGPGGVGLSMPRRKTFVGSPAAPPANGSDIAAPASVARTSRLLIQ